MGRRSAENILRRLEEVKKKQAIRKQFWDECVKRDGYKCVVCKYVPEFDQELDVHHVLDCDFLPKELQYVPENGVTLCRECHLKAEKFHQSKGKSWTHGLHPDDLYSLIRSPWRTKNWEVFRIGYYE